MTVQFALEGQEFIKLNGGPHFKFTEAISFSVDCKTQEEVDEFWEKLSAGGEKGPCGWLKDKYGLSWQINPRVLGEMLGDPDPAKSMRASETTSWSEEAAGRSCSTTPRATASSYFSLMSIPAILVRRRGRAAIRRLPTNQEKTSCDS